MYQRQQCLSTGSASGRIFSVSAAHVHDADPHLLISCDGAAPAARAAVPAARAPRPRAAAAVLVRGNALDDRMLGLTSAGLFLIAPSPPGALAFSAAAVPVAAALPVVDAHWHPLSADHFCALQRAPGSCGAAGASVLEAFCARAGLQPCATDQWRLPPSASPRCAIALGAPCADRRAAPALHARAWEALAAFVLDEDGSLALLCPAVPRGLVVSRALWDALARDAQSRGGEEAKPQCLQWLEGAWDSVGANACQYRGSQATAAFAWPPPALQAVPIFPSALWRDCSGASQCRLVDLAVLPVGAAPAVVLLSSDARVAVAVGWEAVSPAWFASEGFEAACAPCPLLFDRSAAADFVRGASKNDLFQLSCGAPLARSLLSAATRGVGAAAASASSTLLPPSLAHEELGTPWLWVLAAATVIDSEEAAAVQDWSSEWTPCFVSSVPFRPSTVLLCSKAAGLLALRVDGLEERELAQWEEQQPAPPVSAILRPVGVALSGSAARTAGGAIGRRLCAGNEVLNDFPVVSYEAACADDDGEPPRIFLPRWLADAKWENDRACIAADTLGSAAESSGMSEPLSCAEAAALEYSMMGEEQVRTGGESSRLSEYSPQLNLVADFTARSHQAMRNAFAASVVCGQVIDGGLSLLDSSSDIVVRAVNLRKRLVAASSWMKALEEQRKGKVEQVGGILRHGGILYYAQAILGRERIKDTESGVDRDNDAIQLLRVFRGLLANVFSN